jgi:hypothetical protein
MFKDILLTNLQNISAENRRIPGGKRTRGAMQESPGASSPLNIATSSTQRDNDDNDDDANNDSEGSCYSIDDMRPLVSN